MTSRAQVVETAKLWLGTPHQHQASARGVGADCIGFIGGVALECGIAEAFAWRADSRCKGYGRQPDPVMLLAACERYLDEIPLRDVRIADILVFRFHDQPQHFGLVVATEPLTIIHSLIGARKVALHRVDSLWRQRIVRCYRFRELADG